MRAELGVLLLSVGCTAVGTTPVQTSPTSFDHGTSTGPATTMTIGAAGGALTSADGRITLTVPAGALTADTMLSVEPITNTVLLGIQSAYRLGPDGTTFTQPATVTFTYAAADTAGSSTDALDIGYQDSSGAWHAYGSPTLDTGASTVSVSTSHLSDWSLLLGWQIVPGSATVQPTGSIGLTLQFCEPETFDDGMGDELTGLVDKCDADDELPHLVNVSGWSVNGTSGGSATVGTVSGTGKVATYTAPVSAPMSNPVAVSVGFAGAHRGGTQRAVSNITIGGTGWSGTVNWSLTGTVTTTDPMYMKTYTGTGSGSATLTPGISPAFLTVPTVSETYSYEYDEIYTDNYSAQGCTHMVSQTRTWKSCRACRPMSALSSRWSRVIRPRRVCRSACRCRKARRWVTSRRSAATP